MSKDPRLSGFSLQQQEKHQARTEHHVYALGVPGAEAIEGAGGVSIACDDLLTGGRNLVLTLRPVQLGRIEVVVDLATQPAGRSKAHRKSAQLIASAQAMRDLSRVLLEAADAADANRPRPKPVA